MSQAEFIRQAITRATIRPIVTVSPVNDELLSAVGKLTAEYGKIGGNLNQIARSLNEYGTPYNALSVEVRAAISDLAALKFEVLRKVGDAVGNIQALVLCQEKVQIKCNQFSLFFVIVNSLSLLRPFPSFSDIVPHIHLETNIHNDYEYGLYYRMFQYIQKLVYMHECS